MTFGQRLFSLRVDSWRATSGNAQGPDKTGEWSRIDITAVSIEIMVRFQRLLAHITIFLSTSSVSFGIETAGDLLVDLNASTFDAGTGIWSNQPSCSTCIGDFIADSGPTPFTTAEGVAAISFDGTAFFTGPPAPAGITGADPTRSVEVWALNPLVDELQETMVSWGHLGGPRGSLVSFNYGVNRYFGAVHHNGRDFGKGWNTDDLTAASPVAHIWHHLVYTYDGTTTRVYSDGALIGEEVLGAGVINTLAVDDGGNPLPMRIAAQNDANGEVNDRTGSASNDRGSMLIGAVRVHEGVLTDEQIMSNFTEEDGHFVNRVIAPEPIPALPIHRYSFSEGDSGTADIAGRVIVDSIGGADGVVKGIGSTASSTTLSLKGGESDSAAYVDLPNGLISGLTDATLEGWFTSNGPGFWSKVFDFGSSEGGEFTEPGGSGLFIDSWHLTAQLGERPEGNGFAFLDRDHELLVSARIPTTTAVGEQYHFAAVYDSDGSADGSAALFMYVNGELRGSAPISTPLSEFNDVNNWLGRSNWTVYPNVQGTYDEFRIYDYALSPDQVAGNAAAGADTINLVPEPATALRCLVGGVVILRRRRRR